MSLVSTLLRELVAADGDAVVLHSGDVPYVDAAGQEIEILKEPLTDDHVQRLLGQLLPRESQQMFNLLGSVQYDYPPPAEHPHEHFMVVASREARDIWVEIRRDRPGARQALAEAVAALNALESSGAVDLPERKAAASSDPIPMLPDAGEIQADRPALEPPAPEVHSARHPPAVILPMSRSPFQTEAPTPLAGVSPMGLERLLRTVAARGGSVLYVSPGERPSMRIDGEIHVLSEEPVPAPEESEMLVLAAMPERTHEALRSASRTEWTGDLEGVGRVRCVTFRDQRGAGGTFRILSPRAATMEQLGLTPEMRALALEPDGLVLVAGPRSSGKSTLLAAYVNLINQTRRDHVITIENEVRVVHAQRGSLISQREVRGSAMEQLAATEIALREDPDVLVIEDLRSDAIVHLAIDAAKSGRLVIAGLQGRTAAEAVDRILDQYQPGERGQAQLAIAATLRGIVVQVLLRKPGGGRIAARGLLLNTPVVKGLIAEGRTSQLAQAIDAGLKLGMLSINAALAGLVQSGAVDIREAYRHVGDRRGFISLLEQHGIETSSLERLA